MGLGCNECQLRIALDGLLADCRVSDDVPVTGVGSVAVLSVVGGAASAVGGVGAGSSGSGCAAAGSVGDPSSEDESLSDLELSPDIAFGVPSASGSP